MTTLALRSLIAIILLLASGPGHALTRQMGVEEAASVSDVVIVGEVTSIPTEATLEGQQYYRHAVVHVIECVNQRTVGDCPPTVTVLLPGGTYQTLYKGVMTSITEVASDSLDLPAVGRQVLLFLRGWSGHYIMSSASYGAVTIADGHVNLLFDDFESLSETGKADTVNLKLKTMSAASPTVTGQSMQSLGTKFHERVSVNELHELFQRLKPKAPQPAGTAERR